MAAMKSPGRHWGGLLTVDTRTATVRNVIQVLPIYFSSRLPKSSTSIGRCRRSGPASCFGLNQPTTVTLEISRAPRASACLMASCIEIASISRSAWNTTRNLPRPVLAAFAA